MAVEDEKKKKKEKTVKEDLLDYLQDYRDVFDKKEFDELPPRDRVDRRSRHDTQMSALWTLS